MFNGKKCWGEGERKNCGEQKLANIIPVGHTNTEQADGEGSPSNSDASDKSIKKSPKKSGQPKDGEKNSLKLISGDGVPLVTTDVQKEESEKTSLPQGSGSEGGEDQVQGNTQPPADPSSSEEGTDPLPVDEVENPVVDAANNSGGDQASKDL